MKQKTGKKGQAVNVLFTMLLFLVFVLCALFTVLIGGKVYENISARMEENYTGSTALNYVANKVRQGDMEGAVSVVDINGTSVLQLKQQFGEETYVTQIYYLNGSIRELFTDLAKRAVFRRRSGDHGQRGNYLFPERQPDHGRNGRGRRQPPGIVITKRRAGR